MGRKLLKIFLEKLAQAEMAINFIGCVNSGINLTTEGSEVLDSLRKLEAKGATIATCGTCLDFHHRRDKLAIGVVGSMDQTVQLMGQADRIIRP